MENLIYAVPAMGIIGLLYTFLKFKWVSSQDAGNDRMKEISKYIARCYVLQLKSSQTASALQASLNIDKGRIADKLGR